jgi:hypothetical protein
MKPTLVNSKKESKLNLLKTRNLNLETFPLLKGFPGKEAAPQKAASLILEACYRKIKHFMSVH